MLLAFFGGPLHEWRSSPYAAGVFALLQPVELRGDAPQHGLRCGARGAVVDLLRGDGVAYEVEVVDKAGRPVFLGALPASLLEPVG